MVRASITAEKAGIPTVSIVEAGFVRHAVSVARAMGITKLPIAEFPGQIATSSSEEIEEERRLLYVAMTRARDHLHLMLPQRFYVHQQRGGGGHCGWGGTVSAHPPTVTRWLTLRVIPRA